jgi:tetratricopeptide (TPR) repeat protein
MFSSGVETADADFLLGAVKDPKVSEDLIQHLLSDAIKQISSGDINDAINTYFKVLDADPFRIDANLALGSILLSLKKSDMAEGFLYTAVKLSNWLEPAAVANLAEALRLNGDLDLAEQVLQKGLTALRQKDSSGLLPYALGILHTAKKEYVKAADWFLSAAVLQSNNIGAWERASTMMFPPEGRDLKFAENVLMQGLESNPKSPALLFRLGTVLQYAGSAEKAIPLYETTLQIDRDFHEAESTLATAYHSVGRYSDALRTYSKAEEHDGSNVIMLSNYAMLLCTEGVDQIVVKGVELAGRALAMAPDNADAAKAKDICEKREQATKVSKEEL